MHRRAFVTTGLACSSLALTGQAWSAPTSDQRLLVVFLRGGYDAMNVVVPTSSDYYYEARPTIGIARPDIADPNAALSLDANWSLHPALKDSLYALWQQKKIAFVPFAGTDDLSRSHFETQDTIELGQPFSAARNYRSGFMARLATELSSAHPIAFTSQPPLAFRGGGSTPNVNVAAINRPGVDARQSKLIEEMYRGRSLQAAISEGFAVRDEAYSTIAGEMIAANRNAASPGAFEVAARRVGRMMKTNYNLAFLDVGGWDTHVHQGAASGVLAVRISQLGKGLIGLVEELGNDAWSKTTVIVISEFGRTFKENGDKGTDHGHGSVYWILGGSVNGGRIAGDQLPLTPDHLNQGRDLKVLTNYRSLIGGIVRRLYGLNATRLDRIFPASAPASLNLV